MVIILHADTNDDNIGQMLGTPDYSYYFVLREFRPILKKIAAVVTVKKPHIQVDAIFTICQHIGESCFFLSFTPPHKTPIDLKCPTIPVFAWEFYDIPNESWDPDIRNDWSYVLAKLGSAITHSRFAAKAVYKALGEDYPIASVPAPVWNRFAGDYAQDANVPGDVEFELAWHGLITDSSTLGLAPEEPSEENSTDAPSLSAEVMMELDWEELVSADSNVPTTSKWHNVKIGGIVYTSVFNPQDGRKNWVEMPKNFCFALKDCADATLILKLTYTSTHRAHKILTNELKKLAPFRCRVIIVDGFLGDDSYKLLLQNSTYAVNVSHGEGQCLPLMEYMSCGKPAIAPRHTGMEDYLDNSNAFLVDTSLEICAWPQDPRFMYRTLRHRLDAESLRAAFLESYRLARQHPDRYRTMSLNATRRLREHCSEEVVEAELRSFFRGLEAGEYGNYL